MNLKRPDYSNSIMNVSNSFLKYHNVETKYPSHKSVDDMLCNGYNHIIYVLLDGMGSNIIKKHLNKTDVLYKYMKEEITSVFPPTTVAATNSVLSGLPPIETGYIGWVQYFKQYDSDVTIFLNKDFYTGKVFDEVIRTKHLSYNNILQKIKNKNPDIHTNIIFPSYIEEGTAETFKEEIEQVLLITHNTDKSFNYVYWIQPDLIEHKVGINSHDTEKMLKSINEDFEELLNNITDDTLVVCIADHGLVDVEEVNILKYEKLSNMLKRKPSIEPRACNFFVKDGLHEQFKVEFNTHFENKFLLMSKADLLESELLGTGNQHQLVDQFLGDFLAVAIDKYMFSVKDDKIYKAHHAGLTEDEMMVPLIMYSKK